MYKIQKKLPKETKTKKTNKRHGAYLDPTEQIKHAKQFRNLEENTKLRLELEPKQVRMTDTVSPSHFEFPKGYKPLQISSVILEESE